MPIPLLPLLALGSGIASTGINALSQSTTNRANRRFSREMYWRQREDSLADWNMQNAYNSPEQQMQRLKDAGLNPNLVYGNGATAMSSQMPRQSSGPGAQSEAPRVDLQTPFMGYADLMMKNAQVDLIAQQKEKLAEETMLVNIQQLRELTNIDRTKIGTDTARFDLAMKQKLADISFETKQVELTKKYADLQYTLDENARREVMTGRNVIESIERVLNYEIGRAKTQQEIDNLKTMRDGMLSDNRVKALAARLADQGIAPNSPWYVKAIEELIGAMKVGKLPEAIEELMPKSGPSWKPGHNQYKTGRGGGNR